MSDFNHIPAVLREIERRTEEVAERSAKRTQKRIVEGMNEGKSGRTYGSHQASAPGESPAVLTHDLEESIQVIPGEQAGEWQTIATDEKAELMEFGTVKTDNLKPRPFMKPGADAEQPEMVQDAEDTMRGLGQ